MTLTPGDVFRRFRILDKVGEGAMGVVYRAHDTRLDREVALKFVTHEREHDPGLGGRLRREAAALAALNHPNIVAIHDIDEADEAPCLVLEWIDGRPLGAAFTARPVPARDALPVLVALADALGAAHAAGIVHRDVKPSNVLVTRDGRTKVVDFGVSTRQRFDLDATRTAGVIGTVAYMSPEQARGTEVGPASDVFSFGIVAYELLAGRRPFVGDGPGAVLEGIMSGRHEPLVQARPGLPAAIAAVIERCLDPDPARRFASGATLARALRTADRPSGTVAGAPGPGLPRPAPADPPPPEGPAVQEIRFCTTHDGVRIAYTTMGRGPLLVRVLGHFTHLEMEWEWPDLRRLWTMLAERHTVVRYDGRGIGLSDRYSGEFTEETRQLDLDAVLAAVGGGPASLLGISEGGWTAATYAVEHPDRVSRLVLYGAYCRGARVRPGYDPEEDQAMLTLIRKGWGRDTPVFRQMFTSLFFREDADPKLIAHFNAMQRASADADTAARYHASCHLRGDGRDLFRRVTAPTLVVHCRDDLAVSADEGRLLASTIPGAQLALLPSGSHHFPTDPGVVTHVVTSIDRFVHGAPPPPG